ncbi:hypothetical protein PT974_01541 [Cladobotryum mycophilum]|uniref:Zn(2)-C6 fungal-type domain-containing protein n=1 Tax=Cladobotryum mycophilum TaxID=491253 RepID=A0ABR0T4W3_9HYPO
MMREVSFRNLTYPPPAPDPGRPDISPLSCVSCKRRKQKCDRVMPSCSRCNELLLKCVYTSDGRRRRRNSTQVVISPHLSSSEGVGIKEEALAQALLRGLDDASQLRYTVVDNKSYMASLVEKFDSTIYRWMPVLSPRSVLDRLHGLTISTNGDNRSFIALIMGICLVATHIPRSLQRPFYAAAKSLYWKSQPMTRPCPELAQTGILLSIHEYAHGKEREARVTIETCLSMIKLWDTRQSICEDLSIANLAHEQTRIVWGALIMERIIALKGNFIIHHLPAKILQMSEQQITRLWSSLGVIDTPFLSFHFQILATILSDLVLCSTRDENEGLPAQLLHPASLRRRLLSFLELMLRQEICKVGLCCEATAITVFAFIHLHKHNPGSDSQDSIESDLGLEQLCRIITTGVQEHLESKSDQGRHGHPAPFSIYMIKQLLEATEKSNIQGREESISALLGFIQRYALQREASNEMAPEKLASQEETCGMEMKMEEQE